MIATGTWRSAVAIVIAALLAGGVLIWVGWEQQSEQFAQVPDGPDESDQNKPADEPVMSPPQVSEPVTPGNNGASLEDAAKTKPWKPGEPFKVRPDLKTLEAPK